MANLRNRGMLFYPMEVGHTSNKRIMLLFNDHGSDGYWVWKCIIDEAYKKHGYYFPCTGDDIELISAMVCRKTPELVWGIISSCIKRGLFDRQVYEKQAVLTSDKMQINYINATFDRRRKGYPLYFQQKYFVLSATDLHQIGEKSLQNILFAETSKSILDEFPEFYRFSGELQKNSTENGKSSSEKHRNSVHKGKERIGKDIKYSDTTVSPPTNGVTVGIEQPEATAGLATRYKGKKKVAPKKKARNPDAEPYWQLLRRVWVDFNNKHVHFNVEPMPKKDYSSMHRIIEKLRERAVNQAVEWTEPEALIRWEKFLTVAYTQSDEWLHTHFELGNLDSQKQTIFKLIENGGTQTHIGIGKNKLGTSAARSAANKNFGLAGKIIPRSDQETKNN